jgi:hypothetical protein
MVEVDGTDMREGRRARRVSQCSLRFSYEKK